MSAPLLTRPPGRPFVVRIATPHDLLDADRGHAGEPGGLSTRTRMRAAKTRDLTILQATQ